MNTRQKLTLGIAAIFMVTLTIIGVTYAYFVTRVTGSAVEDTVEVSTATLATVKYVDEGDVVEFINVQPGVTKYKTFTVSNKAAAGQPPVTAAGAYTIFLENTDGSKEFVKSADGIDVNTVCYNQAAAEAAALIAEGKTSDTDISDCYDGEVYDNLYVSLYRVASNPNTGSGSDELDEAAAEELIGAEGVEVVKSETNLAVTGADAPQLLTSKTVQIPAETDYHYILKVEYRSVDKNQSIEQAANVKIKVNIA